MVAAHATGFGNSKVAPETLPPTESQTQPATHAPLLCALMTAFRMDTYYGRMLDTMQDSGDMIALNQCSPGDMISAAWQTPAWMDTEAAKEHNIGHAV